MFQAGALPPILGPHLLQLAKLLSQSFEHGVFFFHVARLGVHESTHVHLLFFLLVSSLEESSISLLMEDTYLILFVSQLF